MALDRTLHHFTLDPFSRTVRLVLGEKRLSFSEQVVRYWEQPEGLSDLNPSGLPPVLVDGRGRDAIVVCETRAILEHLEERHPAPALLPADPNGRAEVRRLLQWFERKFDYEVNGLLLHEKMEKRLLGLGAPELAALRAGREALRTHMAMVELILKHRHWLAGPDLTMADLAGAAHLSVIDYMGEAPWDDFPHARDWYTRLKSRPAFRPLLADRQPGLAPSAHYDDLDF